MCRILGSVWFFLLVTAVLPAPARASETIDLSPRFVAGQVVRVSINLEAGGHLIVRVEDAANQADGEQQRPPISVAAKLQYDERRLVGGPSDALPPGKSLALRYYEQAEATIKAEQGSSPRLGEPRRLILVEQSDGRPILYAPSGPLTRHELDLIDVVGNSTVLDQLLPSEPVAEGDTWKPGAKAMAGLLTLDAVSACEVQSVLDEFNASFAKVRLAGVVHGMVDGSPTEQEIRAVYLFDRARHRIARMNIAVREERSIGHATPGIDAVAKLQMKIDPLPAGDGSPQLSDEVVAAVTGPHEPGRFPQEGDRALPSPASESQKLLYHSPPLGFRIVHDRLWHVTSEGRETVTLRRVDRGDLVAHCTITTLAPKSAGRQTSLEEFQKDIAYSLGKNFGEFVASRQWISSRGYNCYEVVVRGLAEEVPIEWHYYLIAQESGHRISVAVTIEGSMVQRLADADRVLIESLELIPLQQVSLRDPDRSAETAVK